MRCVRVVKLSIVSKDNGRSYAVNVKIDREEADG